MSPALRDDRADLLAQWEALGADAGLAGPAWTHEGRRLLRSWSRWPRRYHDRSHLAACLRHAEAVRGSLQDAQAVVLALWFHDAVYWPWSRRNEERSAAWAVRFLGTCGWDAARTVRVARHILATRDHQCGADGDRAWMLDIDLAVLGAEPAIYRRFEHGVRSEYRWVRWSRYVAGRSAVLHGFLDRPHIYLNPSFTERFESPARRNLQAALKALEQGRLYES